MTSAMELNGKGLEAAAHHLGMTLRGNPALRDGIRAYLTASGLAAKDVELVEVRQQYVDANEARIDAEAALANAQRANVELNKRVEELEQCADALAAELEKYKTWSALDFDLISKALGKLSQANLDNTVLREAAQDFASNARTWLNSRAENAKPGWMRAKLPALEAALSNQPTASLKVEGIPSGYGEYTPITVSASTSQPAEGQGERDEAWFVSATESDGRTYLCLTRNDGVSAALSCRTNTDNGETIVSQVAKQFAADYAAPPAPNPLEGNAMSYWRSIDTAPEDQIVILATSGGHVGEAAMLIDEDTGKQKWTWAVGPVHPGHEPYGWQPMPSAIDFPVPSDLRDGGFDGPTGAE